MALTADELAYVRLQSGDDCTPYVVSDVQVQAVYAASSSDCATIIAIIQARLAYGTKKSGVNESTGAAVTNPSVIDIKTLLDYWQSICPDTWPQMGQFTIDLGIDEVVDTA